MTKMTFGEFLREKSRVSGDAPALICEGRSVSFRELCEMAENGASLLKNNGVSKGDRVVLWGFNSIEWVIAFYSVILSGGIAVLMNYGISAEDAGRLSEMVGASFMLYSGTRAMINDSRAPQKAALRAGIGLQNVKPMEYLSDGCCKASEIPFISSEAGCRDTSVIIFTTGTTSSPKAVQLSAYSILNDASGAYEVLSPRLKDSLCAALPLFHSYGLLVLHVYLISGKRTHLVRMLKPDVIADLIGQGDVTDMASVGAVYAMMTRLPQFEEKVSGRLNVCIVGGGFTTPAEMMRLEQAFGGAKILCGYGQTECSPVIAVESADDALELRAVSVGHILPGIDVRVWRSGTGFVSHGEPGEIVIKGYCTMNGYYGSGRDSEPFDSDGWLHTGDIGRLIDKDMLQITGRIKDIIIRCGENVSPVEVEQALMSVGGVRSAKVLGAPHRIWGESVEACVIPEYDMDKSQEEGFIDMLMHELKQKLSSYKVPSHIFLYSSFPLCDNGKTDIRSLREDMLGRLPALSAFSDGYDLGKTMLYQTEKFRRMINDDKSRTEGNNEY